jgi:hypothetical protein
VERLGISFAVFTKANAQYISAEFATEAIITMGEIVQDEVCAELGIPTKAERDRPDFKPPELSINRGPLTPIEDCCLDKSVHEQSALIVRGVKEGRAIERFIALNHVTNKTADTIYDTLTTSLTALGVHASRVLGSCSDGVSSWTGKNNGVAVKLKTLYNALNLHVWCAAHKLNLLSKYAADSVRAIGQNFNSTLDGIYGIFCQSGPRTDKMEEITQAMNMDVLHISESGDTRWLSRGNTCEKMERLLPALQATMIMESFNPNAADKAKVPAMAKKLQEWEFTATLLLMCDLLPICNRLSLCMQRQGADWFRITKELRTVREEITTLKDHDGAHLRDIDNYIAAMEHKVHSYGDFKVCCIVIHLTSVASFSL